MLQIQPPASFLALSTAHFSKVAWKMPGSMLVAKYTSQSWEKYFSNTSLPACSRYPLLTLQQLQGCVKLKGCRFRACFQMDPRWKSGLALMTELNPVSFCRFSYKTFYGMRWIKKGRWAQLLRVEIGEVTKPRSTKVSNRLIPSCLLQYLLNACLQI